MLLLNFSHPLTSEQIEQVKKLANENIDDVRTIPVQIDHIQPLDQQITALVDTVGLTAQEWQTAHLLINPPGYAPAAFVLLAELHGRIGHFPTLLRLRPTQSPITTYEAAELINLQAIRDTSRQKR
jgi:hypothetical protein